MIDIFLEKLLLDVAGYLHDSSANDWQRDPVLAATTDLQFKCNKLVK